MCLSVKQRHSDVKQPYLPISLTLKPSCGHKISFSLWIHHQFKWERRLLVTGGTDCWQNDPIVKLDSIPRMQLGSVKIFSVGMSVLKGCYFGFCQLLGRRADLFASLASFLNLNSKLAVLAVIEEQLLFEWYIGILAGVIWQYTWQVVWLWPQTHTIVIFCEPCIMSSAWYRNYVFTLTVLFRGSWHSYLDIFE